MGKRVKKSKRLLLIIEFFLIILIIGSGCFFFYYYSKTNGKQTKSSNYQKELLNKENIIKEKDEQINKLEKEKNEYASISKKINSTQNKYFEIIKKLENDIKNGKSDKKIAYLTFDDGPYYNTYRVLDILDQYQVKATFFTTSTNGRECYDNKSEDCFKLYKEYIKRGHTIANHTYTHGIFNGLYNSVDTFMDAVIKQEEHIKEQMVEVLILEIKLGII